MKSRFPKNLNGRSCTNQRAENNATAETTIAPATSSCQAKEPVSSIQKKQHSMNVAISRAERRLTLCLQVDTSCFTPLQLESI
ncbi:MAG: hypothetical protein V8S72_06090 [Oscillospiraceae bacterium]